MLILNLSFYTPNSTFYYFMTHCRKEYIYTYVGSQTGVEITFALACLYCIKSYLSIIVLQAGQQLQQKAQGAADSVKNAVGANK